MARTRDEMKEAVRASGLGVMTPEQYEAELSEYEQLHKPTMTEMAQLCAETIEER
jgi:hypothetical protein